MKVLVIDDSLSACRSISRILMDSATTYCCTQAQDWAEHYNKDKPDVILLDIMMPAISGTDVLQQIRQVDTDTPVIMVSAISDSDTMRECLKKGASGYITKPVLSDKIKKAVADASRVQTVHKMTDSIKGLLKDVKGALEC